MFKSKLTSGEAPTGGTTIIGAGTVISGDIKSDGDIRIDGLLNGNLFAKSKIFIGPEGTVEGDIHGQHADVLGKVTGQIRVKDLLQLLGKCDVLGDIFAGKLQVEPSARFNGSCHTGGSVVELNKDLGNVVNQ
ncbi:MAG: polymer-forming cytoskeletal protein [Aquabacterium sp.]|nr:polymer-forming cytoskeletal protein [Ferruginibacter sp.]